MSGEREIRIHGFTPVRLRDGTSRIEALIELRYLKGSPVEAVVLSPRRALALVEQLVKAVIACEPPA